MFGYITTSKQQLGDECYNSFCTYYCGLCKALGNHSSQSSRLGLNYDLTFLAIVLSSIVEDGDSFSCKRCIVHPIKKRPCLDDNYVIKYCAMMSALLSYEKLYDDWYDEKSIKALFGMLLYRSAYKKAIRNYEETSLYIRSMLVKLREIEKENIKSIDEAADKFALILQKLFTPDFVSDTNIRRQLEWFGYNIGRWIYIIDAVNDLEKDYNKKNYNALLSDNISNIKDYCRDVCKRMETTLTFTLENAAEAFDLMKLYRNEELLNKMMYISLPAKQSQILNNTGEDNESL